MARVPGEVVLYTKFNSASNDKRSIANSMHERPKESRSLRTNCVLVVAGSAESWQGLKEGEDENQMDVEIRKGRKK